MVLAETIMTNKQFELTHKLGGQSSNYSAVHEEDFIDEIINRAARYPCWTTNFFKNYTFVLVTLQLPCCLDFNTT